MTRISLMLALVMFVVPVALFAQEAADPAPPDSAVAVEEIKEVAGDSTATVMLLDEELFTVGPGSVINAPDRAKNMSEAILEAAKSNDNRPEDFRILTDDRINATLLMCKDDLIAAVFEYEAVAMGMTADELAQQRIETIRQAVIDYRQDVSGRALIIDAGVAVVAIVLLLVLLKVISRLRRRLDGFLEKRLSGKTLFKILTGDGLATFARTAIRLIHFVVVVWLILMTFNFILSLFPWTHGVASRIFEMALGPVKTFGTAFVEYIPSLFFLAFTVVATIFVLRGIRFFFDEIRAKRLRIRGFHSDWASPTFNIVRLAVVAFAFVLAFPYIPGSNSAAFKGMSIFIGVIVSLGSGSSVANIISGVILIYMRPFEIGDRVRIGDTVGDVVDRNLLTTRLRTTKNERVTIPNTNILSGQIINYTSKARTKELILHTSVTIGYDAPWKTVHELLIGAAKATENVMDDPEPFVLQLGLHDFYVEYELNAHTDKPRLIPAIYSLLHQNIQDRFNEAGVEILSPHYRLHRDDIQNAGKS